MARQTDNLLRDRSGAALFIAAMYSLLFMTISVLVIQLSFGQRTVSAVSVGSRSSNYLLAQSGIVEAMERLRKNINPYNGAAFDTTTTYTYYLDIDADTISSSVTAGVHDVRIEIAIPDASGLRRINATTL